MRFTLAQLKKTQMPYSYDETIDLSNELDGLEDIVKSTPCIVKSTIMDRGDETYKVKFNINITLTLEDSVSLKHFDFPIDVDAEEIFSTDESNEDAFLIDGITLDTKEAILANILINKPMATTVEEFESDLDDSEEEKINPAFASLKDLL
ncbi:MAG: DUF177 domain-containing protein [Acholeplasmatales bacterium]|jgi:uncharacterized metal-binding protein YceD (DUF177 family)|nr:DUF177 domain-containing protein [Acholeplasmatales bacterium]